MNTGTYSTNKISKPLWLLSGVVAVILIALGIFINNIIVDNLYKESRLYQTALQITDKDQFNYSIESRQGNILAYGEFSGENLVKFPEMNKSFLEVEKVKERYTRHEDRVCEEDDNGNEHCHTEVHYSWDRKGSDVIHSNKVNFMGEKYSYDLFDFRQSKRAKTPEIINGSDDYYYPDKKKVWFGSEDEGDIRYYYQTIDPKFNGSILINSYNGSLQPIQGKKITVQSETIKERIDGVRRGATIGRWSFIIFWSLFTIGAVVFTTYSLYEKF